MRVLTGTPKENEYRFPAEWEPHEATWIAWPHNRNDWPGKLAAVKYAFAEMARHLTRGERLHVLVTTQAVQQQATSVLVAAGIDVTLVKIFRVPTDRSWTRDSGPMFVKHRSDSLAVVDFRFNAWAKYRDFASDAKVPSRIARLMQLPRFSTTFNLEGGAFDTNGDGVVLTTEECMLDQQVQVRNPGLDREHVERAISDYLNATRVVWLGKGISGDDTHGHIDDFCRFVNRTTIVLCQAHSVQDSNHQVLEENRERLEETEFDVVRLPMPTPLFFRGRRLPASYANFYIANDAVLVPTFNDERDRIALGILSELFADRKVIGIHAVDLVWGFGTLHCLTQQQPFSSSSATPRMATVVA